MPNTIQIRGSQIQAETIEASNINLSGSFDFRAASSFIAATPSADADVATKGYVDSQIQDGVQAGNGIDIDTATSPDTISVKFATDGALSFIGAGTDELSVKVKAETGGSITKDANGLYIADSAIGNAKLAGSIANDKLANSTISGVALGSNLNSLSAAADGAITFTSFNGSAAVSNVSVQVDGSTLAKASNALKVADGGVDSLQIADSAITAGKIASNAVETAKVANDAITEAKISFEGSFDVFSPDGSTAAFNLSARYTTGFEPQVMAFKNGLLMRLVASSPADADQYTVSDNGSVSTITFGANLSADDTLEVRYISNK